MSKKLKTNMSFDLLLKDFLEFLKNEKSYNQSTITCYYYRLYKISRFMIKNNIINYSQDVGKKYYEYYILKNDTALNQQKVLSTAIRRLNAFYTNKKYVYMTTKNIKFLPINFEKSINLFIQVCYEKGNKENTLKFKSNVLRAFLKDCIELGCNSLSELQPTTVSKSCLKVNNKDSWAVIRVFLKNLAIIGAINTDLSLLVPHNKHPFKIPTTFTKEEIKKVENIIERCNSSGKRDYAMILMATRLGMRAGDIVNITFENIDFLQNKIIFNQQKTNDKIELPLIDEIKEALLDYINNSRPKTKTCTIFIKNYAPYQKLTSKALHYVTTKYFKAANINIEGKKHGPHTFRSSLVSSMINDNIPYEAVRRIIGHTNLKSIKHYAKLDIELLRQCAIEVPEPSGRFEEFLNGGEIQ